MQGLKAPWDDYSKAHNDRPSCFYPGHNRVVCLKEHIPLIYPFSELYSLKSSSASFSFGLPSLIVNSTEAPLMKGGKQKAQGCLPGVPVDLNRRNGVARRNPRANVLQVGGGKRFAASTKHVRSAPSLEKRR